MSSDSDVPPPPVPAIQRHKKTTALKRYERKLKAKKLFVKPDGHHNLFTHFVISVEAPSSVMVMVIVCVPVDAS